ncbi:MAG: DUF362 domain-containing protein [Bacillota bacterium]
MNKLQEIHVIYGDKPKEMVKKLLGEIKPEAGLPTGIIIGLKPNLVVAQPAELGATTSPEITAGIIEYFQEKGFLNLVILESSWLGDNTVKAFKECGYNELSQKYNVPLFDLKKDETIIEKVGDYSFKVCRKVKEVDYLINIPVLKAHCQTEITCALKNLKGCIPDSEKRRFHSTGLHKPIAYLNKVIKSDMIIVDGIRGDLTYEGGGNPVEMGRIIAGFDPVLVDSYVGELLGFHVDEIKHVKLAHEMGLGKLYGPEAKLIEMDKDKMPPIKLTPSRKVSYLSQWVVEDQACSPCYGSLIHALDKLNRKGKLKKFKGKIYIGRGFQESDLPEIGIGLCTKGFKTSLPGCPPKARDLVEFLEKYLTTK